jgi:hypothetical protein
MIETNLLRRGAEFATLMADYRAAQSQLSALQHEADRTAADAGFVYGSLAWSEHRFAVTGRTVHHVNALYEKLEDLVTRSWRIWRRQSRRSAPPASPAFSSRPALTISLATPSLSSPKLKL